jgi:alpha-galactosidase
LNLGNPAARQWLTDHIDKLLTEQGIDLYRQDFNMDPLGFWRANDAPDRQGITEIKHVTGYLAYWDELRRRHPNMLIDSCASGGRRNDLETMRRAVPLWRSDYAFEPIGHQCMTYGISLWLPYHGTGTVASAAAPYYGGGFTKVEPYAFWSNAAPSLGSGIDLRVREIDYNALRRLLGQWRALSQYYYGDFYPLTPYTQDNKAWIAWQFDVSERGEGAVQAFRRAQSPVASERLKLHGLEPEGKYTITVFDSPAALQLSGRELLDRGLPVNIPEQPGAAVITYKRQ